MVWVLVTLIPVSEWNVVLALLQDPVTAGVPASGSCTSGCFSVIEVPSWLTECTVLLATIFPPKAVCPIPICLRFDPVARLIVFPEPDELVVKVPPNATLPPILTGIVPTRKCSVYVFIPEV